MTNSNKSDPKIIVCNLHHRFTGVTATIKNTLPHQMTVVNVAVIGKSVGLGEKHISFFEILRKYAFRSSKKNYTLQAQQ